MMTPLRRISLGVLAGILVMAAIGYFCWPRPIEYQVDYKMPGNPGPKIAAAQAAAIERREKVVDQTIWRKEMEAQEYGRVVEDFWDALNAATNKWDVVERLPFESIVFGEWKVKESLGHGIERWVPDIKSETRHLVSYNAWQEEIQKRKQAGWGIMQCEFRHNAFDPQTNDIPAKSKFYFSVHLTNASPARASVEGDLIVDWQVRETNQPPKIHNVDGSQLQVMFRGGQPAFVPILHEAFDQPDLSIYIEPLNVYDLDGDGSPEIILPALNRVFRRRGSSYTSETLYPKQRLQILNGIFADFDGDGIADFLYAEFNGLFLLKGGIGGKFEIAPRNVSGRLEDLDGPRTLTCGDIDDDGDLDIYLGQYKGPFIYGSIPTPYYDANDGYPSYLLLNDGHGNFRDATPASGLAPKRLRRVLAASFVDVNADGALDLVVTSDFAGVDLYFGDGHGHFADVTKDLLPDTEAFGMAHTFADFNNDGHLDFLIAGMTSPTVDRLEHLGLKRPNSKLDPTMRAKMVVGSRLFLGSKTGRFSTAELASSISRTGWSWGIAAADLDNDGWADVYVANGLESHTTVRDYEAEFWLHDIFVGNSQGDLALHSYFSVKGGSTRGRGMSYGGFEKNRLYLNRFGKEFINVAHLFGVASEEDCRNLVVADLNSDGRPDLAFTTIEINPPYKQRLHVFENTLSNVGNWITFTFVEAPGKPSPVGARITLRIGNSERVQQVVTGDSFRSQHPLQVHFGIGGATRVDSAEILWPNGSQLRFAQMEPNREVLIRAP